MRVVHSAPARKSAIVFDDCAKFDHQVGEQLVERSGARSMRRHDEIASALRKHRAEPLARLEDPLDEHDVLCPHVDASCDEVGIDEPILARECRC